MGPHKEWSAEEKKRPSACSKHCHTCERPRRFSQVMSSCEIRDQEAADNQLGCDEYPSPLGRTILALNCQSAERRKPPPRRRWHPNSYSSPAPPRAPRRARLTAASTRPMPSLAIVAAKPPRRNAESAKHSTTSAPFVFSRGQPHRSRPIQPDANLCPPGRTQAPAGRNGTAQSEPRVGEGRRPG